MLSLVITWDVELDQKFSSNATLIFHYINNLNHLDEIKKSGQVSAQKISSLL